MEGCCHWREKISQRPLALAVRNPPIILSDLTYSHTGCCLFIQIFSALVYPSLLLPLRNISPKIVFGKNLTVACSITASFILCYFVLTSMCSIFFSFKSGFVFFLICMLWCVIDGVWRLRPCFPFFLNGSAVGFYFLGRYLKAKCCRRKRD